ncbi:hypothetical protein COT95_01635 [Candidatus Falkowbacteria bacterium CG10_big_fil_rev_8_21_14_0_10_37_6]|uniref:Glycosyl transferase family 1 domain-containing protein n=1 Tax=Candidatus Falkowbacteria bacterium CG10_big_fil_rev_8_21_14_0_10_37_6 TaxID=1974563 RepID=A0A2H0V9A1_9BACT|nr:MAG: hypothetical protein COT95_01635 [Candidatus Falkowbacteria bacterium CG10_big_fil_rev_8_21_14_0_10_37_6]
MKIAVITSTFPPYKGGMGNSAYEIARILARENEVSVFTLKQFCHHESGNTAHETMLQYQWDCHVAPLTAGSATSRNDSVHVVQIKPTFSFGFKNGGFVPALYKELKNFDFIYLHYPFFGGAEVVWFFKLFNPKVKLIIHFHMDTPALSNLGKFLSLPSLVVKRSLFKQADKIICGSFDYVAHSSIKKIWQKYPNKFSEIPYGVHLSQFHVLPHDILELNNLREKYKIGEKDKVAMFLGGLDEAHRFKGLEVLLKALSGLMAEKKLKIKFLICGDGDLRHKYEKLAKDLKVDKNVVFTGRVPDEELTLYYNLADIFVLPSLDKSEAFGIVLLEAMACGVPVMASDLPGVRSVFENGKQGYTIAPGSERHLRGKLEEFLKYPQTRLKMGREARMLVEKKYSWEQVAEKIKKIFL